MKKIITLQENSEINELDVKGKVDLKMLQKQVGGYIQLANFSNKLVQAKIDMFVDEEGKLKQKSSTMIISDKEQNKVIDIIVGNIVFAGKGPNGTNVGLTETQSKLLFSSVKIINNDSNDIFMLEV